MKDGMTGKGRTMNAAADTAVAAAPSLDGLARGLGWFSIGLGAIELLAPGRLARGLGMRATTPLVAAYGVREIATGMGILAARDPTPLIWGRVAGDALDVGTLAAGLIGRNRHKPAVVGALAMVLGVTAVDLVCATMLSGRAKGKDRTVRDYSNRTGLPRGVEAARGAARDQAHASAYGGPQTGIPEAGARPDGSQQPAGRQAPGSQPTGGTGAAMLHPIAGR